MKSFAIIGTGAVGGLYGAWLVRAGFDVHFLARSDYHHIKSNGLQIDSKNGDFRLSHINVYDTPQTMPKCDVVIVSLKTTSNNILADIIPHIIKDNGIVLVMQNGMGFEEQIAKIVAPHTVFGVLCFVCSNKIGPGYIHHLDFGHISIGQYSSGAKPLGITEQLKEIGKAFSQANVRVTLEPDLKTARWKKLVWNIPYNGLSVVLNTTTDLLMQNTYCRELVKKIMQEVLSGAIACGCGFEESFIEKMMVYTDSMPPYKTSMKIDFDQKRPMEVESIFGTPLTVAKNAGATLPLISMLYCQLKFLDESNMA